MSLTTPRTETEALLLFLNERRDHVLEILEDLDEETLRKPILPSGWSCLGLVQHLAIDVERFWFRAVVAGDPAVIDSFNTPSNAWQVGVNVAAQDIFALYRREIDFANAIISTTALDTPPAWWPGEPGGNSRTPDLRHLILHVMTETASHTGHLDAARELIDGKLWLVMD